MDDEKFHTCACGFGMANQCDNCNAVDRLLLDVRRAKQFHDPIEGITAAIRAFEEHLKNRKQNAK